MSPAAQRWKAVQMLVLCTGLWAVSFPTMKALTQAQQALVPAAGTWFFTGLDVMCRFGSAGLVMLALCLRQLGSLTRRELEQGVGLAAFGVGGILLQMDGLAYTEASTSAFLTQCYALLIPLWLALRQWRWPAWRVGVSCMMVVAGVAVLARFDWRDFHLGRGEFETLLASVFFTAQILWLERPVFRGNNVNRFSCVMFLAMAALAAPVLAATAPEASACWRAWASGPAVGFMGILVVFSTLGGYMLMNHWQCKLSATEAGLIYCAEPLLTSLLAFWLPACYSRWAGIKYANEPLTWHLLVGGGLITLANLIIQWPVRAPRQNAGYAAQAVGAEAEPQERIP
jgi:drug/metabolite transporter (DMT)-like permease